MSSLCGTTLHKRTYILTYIPTYLNEWRHPAEIAGLGWSYHILFHHLSPPPIIHTYIHTYIHTCIHTYIPTYIPGSLEWLERWLLVGTMMEAFDDIPVCR